MKSVYFANPGAQVAIYRAEIDAAIRSVLDSGTYIHGVAHDTFERAFADYIGTRHAVGVGSGTDALVLALRACGIREGDRVVAPSHTAAATISAIRMVGAIPVFADVDPKTYLATPETIERVMTSEVKAVVLVHLYGNPADAPAVRALCEARNAILVEDCAQATGAMWGGKRVGSIGHAGCFSFFPTKNLGAIGDGGAVVTEEPSVAERVRALRTYGWDKDRLCMLDGVNSRLDEMQAAILSAKLPSLNRDNARRREIAARYNAALNGFPIALPLVNKGGEHVYHLYVVALDARDALRAYLKARGILAGIHYPVPNHLQPVFRPYAGEGLPHTVQLASRILSLPIYPELTDAEVDWITDAVREFFDEALIP